LFSRGFPDSTHDGMRNVGCCVLSTRTEVYYASITNGLYLTETKLVGCNKHFLHKHIQMIDTDDLSTQYTLTVTQISPTRMYVEL